MATYITQVVTLTDASPAFVIPHPKPKSVSVSARNGAAAVQLGPQALFAGYDTFMVKTGETWEWSVNDAVDNVEPATVTATGTGAEVVVMWQRF